MSQHGRIYALPLHLANQIAAGEVIERPASVLKELIENSLDAGATDINVEIDGAGRKLIRVTDNGYGIHQDDLALALSRHATSKLHSTEQLNHIASLGFRGEALPSIASISELTLSSKQADAVHGWQLKIDQSQPTPFHHPIGTTVEVRDLFFNVPARRHFLRSDKTELHHISNTLYRLALSQFETAFTCQLTATSKLKLPAAHTPEQQQQRIAKLCGKTFIENSLYLEQNYNDIKLKGWVGLPEGHRPQTDIYYFFINGRVIRDRMINHAVRQAYNELIPNDRYPAFILYLTLPLDQVDINVHPTKHEVRFRDARLIHGLITHAIQDAIGKANRPQQIETHSATGDAQNSRSRVNAISDNFAHYHIAKIPEKQLNITNTSFGNPICLIANRYLLIQATENYNLIDIQQLDLQQRKLQFRQAITQQTLRSRPILVPLFLSLSVDQISILKQNQTLLTQFGFDLQYNQERITVKAIPSLFSHSSLPDLLRTLSDKMTHTETAQQLTEILSQLIPNSIIQTIQQALEVLKTTSTEALPADCYCSLTEDKLSQLFQSSSAQNSLKT
jgi:DNA mismatch repair protein MutL